jgi:hypothetical protein
MQLIAMRAAVPEEFDNLDVVTAMGRLRMRKDGIVAPFNKLGTSHGSSRETYAGE